MQTIVALSSGQGRAAIAIIRVSGPSVRFLCETVLSRSPLPRIATRVDVLDVWEKDGSRQIIDRALALYFAGPRSVTGEDVLELHVHGGLAVVDSVLSVILRCDDDIRLAEPGEFTRRALENGKLDILEVEALGELLSAQTDLQLRQANRQLSGELGRLIKNWASELIDIRALVEAELDFSDEGDVDSSVAGQARSRALGLHSMMSEVLCTARRGERIREGIKVVIIGLPNAGKSSLMNALLGRDAVIVSAMPGTTRDIIEQSIHIGGWPIILCDTAGMRETDDAIEIEGVRRAGQAASDADIILSLYSSDVPEIVHEYGHNKIVIRVQTKCDLAISEDFGAIKVSSKTGLGLDKLKEEVASSLRTVFKEEPALISRLRQREALGAACEALGRIEAQDNHELIAEELRLASRALGNLSGHVDMDRVLDRLFEGFCIGK